MNSTYAAPQRWTLAADEIAAALVALDLQPGAASPLPRAAVGARMTAEIDPALADALRMLAAPSASLRQRHGGPSRAYGLASTCLQTGRDGIAVALPLPDGRLDLLSYADARSFVDDWLDAYACAADAEIANLLPPPLPLRALPLLLHAIDAFRRASYRSALDYATMQPLRIGVDEFNASLGAAAACSDLRWLMPAFLQLTPGLEPAALAPSDEDLGLLADCELLTLAEDAASFGFGEAGQLLGSEFLLGWQHAIGLELVQHGASGERTLARWFVAPTHLANHCFDLAEDGSVNHQPLRVGVLALRLDELLARAKRDPERVQAPFAAPATCPHCGQPVGAVARFCGSCGAALTV